MNARSGVFFVYKNKISFFVYNFVQVKLVVISLKHDCCKITRFPFYIYFSRKNVTVFSFSFPVFLIIDLLSFFNNIRHCRKCCRFRFSNAMSDIIVYATFIHKHRTEAFSKNLIAYRLKKQTYRVSQFSLAFIKLCSLNFSEYWFILQRRNILLQFCNNSSLIIFTFHFRRLALPGGVFCLPDDPGLPLLRCEHGHVHRLDIGPLLLYIGIEIS